MNGFKIGEFTVDLDQPMPVRFVCEAEKALGMGMNDSSTATLAAYIFVALRNQDPERSAVLIADEVMGMDLTKVEDVESEAEASPPAGGGTSAPENQETSGVRRLEASA